MELQILDRGQLVRAAQCLLHSLQKRFALSERCRVGLRGLLLWLGNGQVDRLHLHAQARERRPKLLRIADRDVAQILRLKILLRHAQDVGLGDSRDGLLILEDEILGITVILVNHQPVDRLAGPVEIEDEAVEHRVLGGLQFLVGDLRGADFLQLLANRLQGIHGVRRLRAAGDVETFRDDRNWRPSWQRCCKPIRAWSGRFERAGWRNRRPKSQTPLRAPDNPCLAIRRPIRPT